jgi:hypothetical protein
MLLELPVAQETWTFRVPAKAPTPARPVGLSTAVVVLSAFALVLVALLLLR